MRNINISVIVIYILTNVSTGNDSTDGYNELTLTFVTTISTGNDSTDGYNELTSKSRL